MISVPRGALVAIAALVGVGLAVLGLTHSLSGGSDPVQAPPTEVRIGESATGTPNVVRPAPSAPPVPEPAPAPLPAPAPSPPPPVEVVPPPPVLDDDDGDNDDGDNDDGDDDDGDDGDDGDD